MPNTEQVIEKLISLTNIGKIGWYYLSDNRVLLDKSVRICNKNNYKDITSFYTQINEGYFVLLEDGNTNLFLITFPTISSKDVRCLNLEKEPSNQQDLLRLQNLVKNLFPNVDSFLENFINI